MPAENPVEAPKDAVDYSGHTPMMAHYLRLTFKGAWILGIYR